MPNDYNAFLQKVSGGSTPVESPSNELVKVSVMTDADCILSCNGEILDCELTAGQISKVDLPVGEYFLGFHDKLDWNVNFMLEVNIPKKKSYMVKDLQKVFETHRKEVNQKKGEEVVSEYKDFIAFFLNDEDKILEPSEYEQLQQKAEELKLDMVTANKIIKEVQNQLKQQPKKMSAESARNAINVDLMSETIEKNDVPTLKTLFRQWQAAIKNIMTDNPQYETIKCMYYMVFAALDSQKLIQENENAMVDDYWRIYWTYIAYMKCKRKEKAEDLLPNLREFKQYNEDNVTLLEVISVLNESSSKAAAEMYKNRQANDYYSSELSFLANAILLEIGLEKKTPTKVKECAFVYENIISFDDPEVVAERRAKDEANQKAKEAAERKAKAEAERKAREEEERIAREEAERVARIEAEKKAKAAAERKAKAEAERKVREEEMERKMREDAELELKRQKIAAELEAEKLRQERANAEKILKEKEAIKKAKEAAERMEKEEKARIEAERKEEERLKEIERAKREAALTAARNKITYTIQITSVSNPIQAMMTTRSLFGWGSAEFREHVKSLPATITSTEDVKEAADIKKKLTEGGLGVNLSAKNALGESVAVTAIGSKKK